jgi:hypothetical protein
MKSKDRNKRNKQTDVLHEAQKMGTWDEFEDWYDDQETWDDKRSKHSSSEPRFREEVDPFQQQVKKREKHKSEQKKMLEKSQLEEARESKKDKKPRDSRPNRPGKWKQ